MNAALAILKGDMLPSDDYAMALYTKLPESDKYTTTFEVRGQGYDLGGQTLKSPVYGETDGGAWMTFPDDVIWPNATISARGAVIYNVRTRVILSRQDFGSDISSTNHEFVVSAPDAPLIQLDYRSN